MFEKEPKRICKGECKQYKITKPKNGSGRYANGQVRCQTCEIWISKEGCKDKQGNQADENTLDLFCKCCNYRVRSKPRNRVYKEKLRGHLDKSQEDPSPMDIEELKNYVAIDSRLQTNYQFVVIKTLLENNFVATKTVLAEAISSYNEQGPINDYLKSVVFNVLETEQNIISKLDDETYKLNVEDSLPFDVLDVISLCNQKIYSKKMKSNPDYFIALGPWESWNYTIDNLPLRWGITDTKPSNTTIYEMASEGDVVFYYSTKHKPAYFTETGFFGVGIIRKKEINRDEKYWPEEKITDKAFFTHKIFIDTLKFAQSDSELLPISEGLPLIKGFNHINLGKPLDELLDNTKTKWNILCVKSDVMGETTEVESDEDESIEDVIEIVPLHLPSGDDLENLKKKIENELLIDGNVIDRIIASLYAGKNILLTGPVGTGKTDLAQKIPKLVWNYYPEVHTATSDWNTQDVIGGIFPKIENQEVKFRIQKGCVTSTVSKNWQDETGIGGIRKKFSKFDSETGKNHDYNGVWLVIDEFNRANIDRAFGQLFTALEYKDQLKMPTETSGITDDDFQTFNIPDDYRIIGTLNTYDRHFLFHLSDALKRRFDFIEISTPSREFATKEISIVHQKAADNESLQNELEELEKSNEKTDKKLYEIMAFIRKSKQLGTALLISILKDMLVYHKMGRSWDTSLDSALVKKILPQIESLPVSALGNLKRFINGDMATFFVNFSHDEHSEKVDDYVTELEIYRKYYYDRFKKNFFKNWINEFKENNLNKLGKRPGKTEEQTKDSEIIKLELNPWDDELKKPDLTFFKKSLENLIEEKEYTSINALESGSI